MNSNSFNAFLAKCKKDIPFFAEAVFGSKLRPKQIEFCEKFQNHRRITFRGGIGFGKTHAEAILLWWALFCHNDVQVTVFGPSEGQLNSGIWKEVGILHARMHPTFKELFEYRATKLYRIGAEKSCFAEIRLANKDSPENARGIHQVNNFVFVDEASGVADEIFHVLNNIMVDANPKLCIVSNPSRNKGYFFDTWEHPTISKGWAKIHGKATDNPDLSQEAYEELVEQWGGRGSRQFRVMVLGEFPLDDEDALISLEDVLAAVHGQDIQPSPQAPIIWGLDPAGPGRDRSVLVKRHDNMVFGGIQQWNEKDAVQLAHRVKQEYDSTPKPLRPAAINVDSTLAIHRIFYSLLERRASASTSAWCDCWGV